MRGVEENEPDGASARIFTGR